MWVGSVNCETALTTASHFSLTCVPLSPPSECIFSFSVSALKKWLGGDIHEPLLMCYMISSHVCWISCNEILIWNKGKMRVLVSPWEAFSLTSLSPITLLWPVHTSSSGTSSWCQPGPWWLLSMSLITIDPLCIWCYVLNNKCSTDVPSTRSTLTGL